MPQPPEILFAHSEGEGRRLAADLAGKAPLFVCVIASTDTALVPGLSAAGASAELIPYTAAADAEVLRHGSARCIKGVPCNPEGPPGPAIITRAALELAEIPHVTVNAGCRVLPDCEYVDLGGRPGGAIQAGRAVPDAQRLYAAGVDLGRELASRYEYLVVGESVPGGTTTALALLLALGIAAEGRVSSSLAGNAHGLKSQIARQALAHLDASRVDVDPITAVETLGDPMQAAAAGIAAGALASRAPTLLAGGTQMIAVVALLRRLGVLAERDDTRIGVATTRWVVEDPTADAAGLMADLGPHPLIATPLSFVRSRHAGLRLYEANLVKEGVGAGGAAVAASLARGVTHETLASRVEQIYEAMQGPDAESAALGTSPVAI